ncbi:hypothetical protein ES708_34196 [subsurface metagenome]
MALSRCEEIVFRELQAMAGDMNQVAGNITRDHLERLKAAEELAKREKPGMAISMRGFEGFDRIGLNRDLAFLRDRLNLLLEYANPEPHDPNIPGQVIK